MLWAHVSNAEVLQRSGLSPIGDILRHRRLGLSLFGHVARLDHGVPAHDALRQTVDAYEGRKAGEFRRVALAVATSGSTRFRRMPTLCYMRCGSEIARDHGAAERFTRTKRRR